MAAFFNPTPEERKALEDIAHGIPGVQHALVANHAQLTRPDRGAHQQQLAASIVPSRGRLRGVFRQTARAPCTSTGMTGKPAKDSGKGHDKDGHDKDTATVEVLVKDKSLGVFEPTGRIVVFGLAGHDKIKISKKITLPVELHGDWK